jgi:ribosomal protein S6--L-glutamate ligase
MQVCILKAKKTREIGPNYNKLINALKERFDRVEMSSLDTTILEVHGNCDLKSFDAILPRIGSSDAKHGYFVLKQLEKQVYFPNKPESYLITSDKYYTLVQLEKNQIPVPETYLVANKFDAKKICKDFGFPVVIKDPVGSHGEGVVIVKDIQTASAVIDDKYKTDRSRRLLIQEFIENPGEDLRLFVINEKVVASMKRIAHPDEIRSGLSTGGSGEKCNIEKKIKEIAISATKAIKADICGVDIIVNNDKAYVIECNLNPGFKIASITKVDIFKKITDFVYKETEKFKAEKLEEMVN